MKIPAEYFHGILKSSLKHQDEITYLGNECDLGSILTGNITFEINQLVYTFKYIGGEIESIRTVHDLDGMELYNHADEEDTRLDRFFNFKEIDELQDKLEQSI